MKYKHLHTWDTLLGSYGYWKEHTQALAAYDNAPLDCIYKRGNGEWECASSLPPTHRFWDAHKAIHGDNMKPQIHGVTCIAVDNGEPSLTLYFTEGETHSIKVKLSSAEK